MHVCCPLSAPRPATAAPTGPEPRIAHCVQQLLCGSDGPPAFPERRRDRRHAYPYLVRLIPLAEDGTPIAEQTIIVVGKHVSNRGMDFYCSQPLPFRRVVACFDCRHGEEVRLVLHLTWCRFCRLGWYENGGRFLQALGTTLRSAGRCEVSARPRVAAAVRGHRQERPACC